MNLLFVADPLHTFKTHKDSTFAMMREAQRRGHRLSVCEPKDLAWQSGPGSYTYLRAHETLLELVCRLLLAKKTAQLPFLFIVTLRAIKMTLQPITRSAVHFYSKESINYL